MTEKDGNHSSSQTPSGADRTSDTLGAAKGNPWVSAKSEEQSSAPASSPPPPAEENVVEALPPALGLIGRLPGQSDFLSTGDATFIGGFEHWYGGCRSSAQERLGEKWRHHYANCPGWRFYLSPGVLGATAWCGVWVPSADASFRFYPLAVAQAVSAVPCAANLADLPWFDEIDSVLVDAREQKKTSAWLVRQLSDLADQAGAEFTAAIEQMSAHSQPVASNVAGNGYLSRAPAGVSAGLSLATLTEQISARMLASQAVDSGADTLSSSTAHRGHEGHGEEADGLCVWWTKRRPSREGYQIVTKGLPNGAALASMISVRSDSA